MIAAFLRLALLTSLFVCTSCHDPASDSSKSEYRTIEGTTMGTYYRLQYECEEEIEQAVFEDLFDRVNKAVSTYDSTSIIRAFNKVPVSEFRLDAFDQDLQKIFVENLDISDALHKISDGSFDPTVMPLVNFWGFGFEERSNSQRELPSELLDITGWDNIVVGENPGKIHDEAQLDFSGVAKGYAVDLVGKYFEENHIINYLIDVGGEMRARGVNARNSIWTIGINRPAESAALNEFEVKLALENKSLATSGNYRNYHVLEDGTKVSHTINPQTGYPERTSLLSATVVADDCSWADGLATACMVMGLPRAQTFVQELDAVEGLFIYVDDKGVFQNKVTSGFHQYLIQ